MALDKQKILNELGSVVNQLQSADCGCMGKIFSNTGPAGNMGSPPCNSMPTCGGYRHGCCHGHGCRYGYNNAPSSGEPCPGRCNPPKLYADTYNYLNQNLMQPVVKEVYDDLKSLTPANTIMNNNACQMGLLQQGVGGHNMMAGQSNAGDGVANSNQMPNTMGSQNPMQNSNPTGNMMNSMPATGVSQQMGAMGGMGAQIMNMMMGDSAAKPANVPAQGNQLTGQMLIDAPNSPHGQIGVTTLSNSMNPHQGNANHGQYNSQNSAVPINNMMQGNQNSRMPNAQYATMNTPGNAMTANAIGHIDPGAQMINSNPAAQQMAASHNPPHHLHGAGISKFNEMFPGVMQGLEGGLNFDPMAIAIQMNPANQQRSAMDAMHKAMMNPNAANKAMTSQIAGVPTNAPSNLTPAHQIQQNVTPNQYQQATTNQQITPSQMNMPNTTNAIQPNHLQQQQIYTDFSGSKNLNQQQVLQQQQGQFNPSEQQQLIDPNKEGLVVQSNLPTISEAPSPNQTMQMQPPANEMDGPSESTPMIKEPILPVDTSKNQAGFYTKPSKQYVYNTLGQPVEMLPANMYQNPLPNLPQTLSPQPVPMKSRNDPNNYSNVKSTVSKTSLMGNKPVGKVPSRNQLQHIYNQYKGSQSHTQQNLIPQQNQGEGASHSDGKLNLQKNSVIPRQVPVERTGGDTATNNQVVNKQMGIKREEIAGEVGDVPVAYKLPADTAPEKVVAKNGFKCRNGLQDQVYTTYNAASWSFHGERRGAYIPSYRYRA